MGGKKRASELMTILFKVSPRNLGSSYAPKKPFIEMIHWSYNKVP